MTTVISTTGLTKRFGQVVAVSELDLTVERGQVVGFLGPNGAGKTTTIRMLLGFLRPSAGACSVLGGSLRQQPQLRSRIGYLPGDLRVDPAMTGEHLFAWYGRLRGSYDRDRVRGLTERLDLDPTRRFGTLSKGNRQKIGLVQAFQHDPDVLILDEPTTGLDPLVQREFLSMVSEAAQRGAAVLFSSHVLSEVERVADRIAIIRAGELVSLSTVDELADQARHRYELRYDHPLPDDFLRGAPGVAAVEIDGDTAICTVDGPLGPTMAAAGTTGLVRVAPVGDDLENMFISLYSKGGADRTEVAGR